MTLKLAFATLGSALLLLASAKPDDPIAAAARGLYAQIEDDLHKGGQPMMTSISAKGCTATIRAKGRRWQINLKRATDLGRADTFIFVKAPGVQLAIVGDATKPDQDAKLTALANALREAAKRCGATLDR